MLISQLHIDQLMQQSLIGARADDPVIPERPSRRPRWMRRRPAGTGVQAPTQAPAPRAVASGPC